LNKRKALYDRYKSTVYSIKTDPSSTAFHQFIANYEGLDIKDDDNKNTQEQSNQQLIITSENSQFFTEFSITNPDKLITTLNNNSIYHALTAHLSDKIEDESESFVSNRYNDQTFYGIFIDTGATGVSTAGIQQVRSL
jgi:hypothetical protein